VKIIRRPDGTLLVKSSSLWIAGLCATAAVLLFWAGFALARAGTLAVAILFLLFAIAWLRESIWIFDPERETVRWSQMRYFRISSGEVPFSEIRGIRIQNSTSGRAGVVTYRLALNTSQGDLPLSDAYSGGQARYAEWRETIERFLETQQASLAAASGEGRSDR
jgi:hypothetical protein